MKLGMQIDYAGGFKESAAMVSAYEKAGLDVAWVAEAYGFDGPTFMGYLAATTDTITIGSGILPIYTRTPTLLAMTAAGMDALTDGRFILGLGASGPQVIEGFHGVKYDAPARAHPRDRRHLPQGLDARAGRRTTAATTTCPCPAGEGTGLGKPLKIIAKPVRDRIPIWIASLGPKNVELTAEIADGWMPIFFLPERARDVWGADLDAGAAKRARRPRSPRDHRRRPRGHRRRQGRGGRDDAPDGGALHRWHGRQGEELLQRPHGPLRLGGGGGEDPGPLPRRQQGRGRRPGARRSSSASSTSAARRAS